MSTPKITRAVQHLFQQISRMARTLTKGLIRWLLRGLLVIGRQPLASKAGFVLPTTVLLLLVVTLTVGAIGYRTYTRSQQAIGERQQRVIYNAATPAIDRAKAKIEFLFSSDRDPRFGGVPSEEQLLGMMLNDNSYGVPSYPDGGPDPYTFPGEDRIDINGDGRKDNAWRYKADLDGDGNPANDNTVVYSIIFDSPNPERAAEEALNLRDSTRETVAERANRLLVRNAPLSNASQSNTACRRAVDGGILLSEQGWFRDENDSTALRKNFQVNAYVLPPDSSPNSTIATLEFQQDRQATQGFKWAAWFRNDLEIFPGPPFNWNGAMHTEGSYFVKDSDFRAYLVSSPASCLYKEDASQLTSPTRNDFRGQFIAGSIRDNAFQPNGNPDGASRFDLWPGEGLAPDQIITMSRDNDSVDEGGRSPLDFSLDPVQLQTRDASVPRGVEDSNAAVDADWTGSNLNDRRMFNQRIAIPYLDDTFRADNRYGPKPVFGYERTPIPDAIGRVIPSSEDELINPETGLDGYWERRARNEGLRLIVGQRLELGDPAGWGGPTTGNGDPTYEGNAANLIYEPLRPWLQCTSPNSRCNEARQRRSLWDNLAAVQATAIYHNAAGALDFPAACLVSTVHPGTAGTLDKSATFENLALGFETAFAPPYNAAGTVISDFFRGRGTNGWEYALPNEDEFRSVNSTLMKALQNLANFAGDPNGGAPSFTPVEADNVHPHPSMAMWGDFSMLRQVIALMRGGQSYASLSPADKTTLHTAGCMLGMLAYNLDYLNKFDFNAAADLGAPSPPNDYNGLRGHIRALDAVISGNDTADNSNPQIVALQIPTEIKKLQPAEMRIAAWEAGESDDPETYVRLLEFWRDSLPDGALKESLTREIFLAQMIITKEQVQRDRAWGFQGAYPGPGNSREVDADDAYSPNCLSWGSASPTPADPLGRLCSNRPRYPILYSLFPLQPHGDIFDASGAAADPTEAALRVRDSEDDLYSFRYLREANSSVRYEVLSDAEISNIALRPLQLGGLGSGGSWTLPTATAATGSTPNSNRINAIKVCPTNSSCSRATSTANRQPVNGTLYRIPFKDAAFMNGRELLNVRTLDIDIELLRTTQDNLVDDYWLPKSGIIYAFREDAVSEAHIVRPTTATWEACSNDAALQSTASCQMQTDDEPAIASTDPPISPIGITPKPVDYFPDPDRRPNGFRLRNGASLWRGSGGSTITDAADPPGRGLSFISHNPVYIQGSFNLHRAPNQGSLARTDGLEEFTVRLNTDSFSNFYSRGTGGGNGDINTNFASLANDQWRPAEVLGDAVTLLSDNFCDGSIEDGFITGAHTSGTGVNNGLLTADYVYRRYGCRRRSTVSGSDASSSENRTSYLNQNRPNQTGLNFAPDIKWLRTQVLDSLWRPSLATTDRLNTPADTNNARRSESPIFVARTGNPIRLNNSRFAEEYVGSYILMPNETGNANGDVDRKPLIRADDGVQMNLILISGLVPSRDGQSYGGLHNFPRFIESWAGKDLFMSGAFLQLNFSSYATAPFDQQAWEPSQSAPTRGAGTNEWIRYYLPPDRRWGFDVALKLAPPGPVAERFRTSEPDRSEFYSEPPADDPYIQNLANCAAEDSCL